MITRLFLRQETAKLWQLSAPVALMQIMRMVTMVIMTAMIARLGTEALAAIAIAYVLFLILILFTNGIAMAIGMGVGQHFGAQELEDVAKVTTNGILLMIIIAIPIMLLMHIAKWLFLLCGQDPFIAQLAQDFLSAVSWAMIPIAVQWGLQQFLMGISKPKILAFFPIVSLLLNVPLAYALILGHWGMPQLGLAGAGYAIAISAMINGLLMILYVMTAPSIRCLRLLHYCRPLSWSLIKSLFLTGLPIGISIIIEIIYLMILVFFLGLVSLAAQAAYQIVSQLLLIAIMIPIAISQASTILLSQHLGRGELERLRGSAILAMIFALLPTILFSLVFWFMPTTLINYFLPPHQMSDQLTRTLAIHMLMITGVIQLVDALRMTLIGSMRGIKDVKTPLYFNLIVFWLIGPPFIAFIGLGLKLGPIAMWISDGVMVLLSTSLLGWRFFYKVKKLA